MYESPIKLYTTALNTQIEAETLNIISKYGINIDKDELIKALRYDRRQYERGYADGKAAALNDSVTELFEGRLGLIAFREKQTDDYIEGYSDALAHAEDAAKTLIAEMEARK